MIEGIGGGTEGAVGGAEGGGSALKLSCVVTLVAGGIRTPGTVPVRGPRFGASAPTLGAAKVSCGVTLVAGGIPTPGTVPAWGPRFGVSALGRGALTGGGIGGNVFLSIEGGAPRIETDGGNPGGPPPARTCGGIPCVRGACNADRVGNLTISSPALV